MLIGKAESEPIADQTRDVHAIEVPCSKKAFCTFIKYKHRVWLIRHDRLNNSVMALFVF